MIKNSGVSVVETMELPTNPIDMVVGLDHIDASYHVVKRMIEAGKRSIAYFGARLDAQLSCVCKAMTKRCMRLD